MPSIKRYTTLVAILPFCHKLQIRNTVWKDSLLFREIHTMTWATTSWRNFHLCQKVCLKVNEKLLYVLIALTMLNDKQILGTDWNIGSYKKKKTKIVNDDIYQVKEKSICAVYVLSFYDSEFRSSFSRL